MLLYFNSWNDPLPGVVPGTITGDFFLHDRVTKHTERVSVGSNGEIGDVPISDLAAASMSSDGRFIAFESAAGNLVPGDDTRNLPDVFLRDRLTRRTIRVSSNPDGTAASGSLPSISADGRFIAFASFAPLVPGNTDPAGDVFVYDRITGQTSVVSVGLGGVVGNGDSYPLSSALSADGRLVAMVSSASNLVPGDSNNQLDVFVHDRETHQTSRMSVGPAGAEGDSASSFFGDRGSISADGRYVAFASWASNLVADDTNAKRDVFLHDRATGITSRVSVGIGGSQANAGSFGPMLSPDGGFVTFHSQATNLVPDDNNGRVDAFTYDVATGTTSRISTTSDGAEANGDSESGYFSADNRYVAFDSLADNIAGRDVNGDYDVFVYDRSSSALPSVQVRAEIRLTAS